MKVPNVADAHGLKIMETIILDTNILITDPSVLTKKVEGLTLIVPSGVRDELISVSSKTKKFRNVIYLVNEAVKNNIIQIYDTGIPVKLQKYQNFSFTDLQLFATALKLIESGTNVTIATLDRKIQSISNDFKINFISLEELLSKISKGSIPNQENFNKAKKYITTQWIILLLNFIVGASASIIANIVWNNIDIIQENLHIIVTIVFILLFPIFLFWFRARNRITYGIAEFSFGFIMATKTFYPNFDYSELKIVSLLQFIAGIYVMIRGMDNFGNGLEGTRFEYLWKKYANSN